MGSGWRRAVVLLSSIIGFAQERKKATRSLAALKPMLVAVVRRDGRPETIAAVQLVPREPRLRLTSRSTV